MNSTPQSKAVELADYQWLVGLEAEKALLEAQKTLDHSDGQCHLGLAERLGKALGLARAHLTLQQAGLRGKAREKFPAAERMFFTPLGLEQSTDYWVAGYKARRFPAAAWTVDLCCGIGGDLMAIAANGLARGVDRDAVTALFAEANGRALRGNGIAHDAIVNVETVEVSEASVAGAAAWHIDPDRRPTGRRTTKAALHEPGPAVIARLLSACPNAAVKLAPAATFDEAWWNEAELEWISRARQCRQLVAWFGGLSEHPGMRRATLIGRGGQEEPVVAASFVGRPGASCALAPHVGRFVLEPDAAVLAAKLEGAIAAEQGLSAIAPGVAYFTADRPVDHAALACFEVLEVMPYRTKVLRQWLAARGVGRLEVKKRGVPLDPEEVRRDLQPGGGDGEATILLARLGGRVTAIVARRVK